MYRGRAGVEQRGIGEVTKAEASAQQETRELLGKVRPGCVSMERVKCVSLGLFSI